MQGKGLITTVFALLVVACVYQLSFTWASQRVERQAAQHAAEAVAELPESTSIAERERRRIQAEQDFLEDKADSKVLLWYTYQDCKSRELNLGLDLQGGMSVVMEVSQYDLVQKLAGRRAADPQLTAALDAAQKAEGRGEAGFIEAFVRAFEEQNPGGQLVTLFANIDNEDELDRNATNGQVREWLSLKAEEGFQATLTKLRERIDRFGVAQASITPVEGQGRIVVVLTWQLPKLSSLQRSPLRWPFSRQRLLLRLRLCRPPSSVRRCPSGLSLQLQQRQPCFRQPLRQKRKRNRLRPWRSRPALP